MVTVRGFWCGWWDHGVRAVLDNPVHRAEPALLPKAGYRAATRWCGKGATGPAVEPDTGEPCAARDGLLANDLDGAPARSVVRHLEVCGRPDRGTPRPASRAPAPAPFSRITPSSSWTALWCPCVTTRSPSGPRTTATPPTTKSSSNPVHDDTDRGVVDPVGLRPVDGGGGHGKLPRFGSSACEGDPQSRRGPSTPAYPVAIWSTCW
jgi:hypothetical protein